jgi:hypothetical protein
MTAVASVPSSATAVFDKTGKEMLQRSYTAKIKHICLLRWALISINGNIKLAPIFHKLMLVH